MEKRDGKPEGHEARFGIPCEIRSDNDGTIRVTGHAAVFNQRADIGGWFTEEFAPGAFREAIGRDDVVFLVNHDGLPLARTRSGTLSLKEDELGLRIDTTLDPEDPDVKAIRGKMDRGDLDKMSIAFSAEVQEWHEKEDELPHRIIREAKLYDVSIVTFPAYDGTDIGMRSLERHRSRSDGKKSTAKENYDARRRRLQDSKNKSKSGQIEDVKRKISK